MFPHIQLQEKRRAGETIDLLLVKSLSNVNDAVKTIVLLKQRVLLQVKMTRLVRICIFVKLQRRIVWQE